MGTHRIWSAAAFFVLALGQSVQSLAGTALFDRDDCAPVLRMWRQLAEGGNPQSQYQLGTLYWNGTGVAKDDAEAVKWYRLSADQGFAPALYDLGIAYRDGRGVAKDEAEYVRWNTKAAEHGFAPAQQNVGTQYLNGSRGHARDFAEAAKWYRMAADQGWPLAQASVGVMYADGMAVPKDKVLAYQWLTLAAQGSDAQRGEQFTKALDQLGRSMSPTEVDQARQQARDWAPSSGPDSIYMQVSRVMDESTIRGGEVVDARFYTVAVPQGDGWKARVDRAYGAVTLQAGEPVGAGLSTIAINSVVFWPATGIEREEDIVAAIQCVNEATFREQGVAKSYTVDNVQKRVVSVGDKKLYQMSYVVADHRLILPVEAKYAFYVYLPPERKDRRQVYEFIFGLGKLIGGAADPGDSPVVQTLFGSFREKPSN
jgi:uncharacterized protein